MSGKAETLRRLIVGDLRRVFRHRYRHHGYTFTNDDAGRDDLELLLLPLSLCPKAPKEKMKHAIELGAPWFDATEAQELIDQIMRLPACARRLSGKELGERLNLTNSQRERWKVWRIAPVDMTADDLKEQQKAKDRARKAIQRHEAGATPHERSLSRRKPWEAEGIGRRQWERRRAKSHVAISSATILLKARNNLRHAPTKLKRPKLARGTVCSHQNQNGKGQRMTKDPFSPRPPSTAEQLATHEREARQAKEAAEAEARLLDTFRSHVPSRRNIYPSAGRQILQTDFGTLVLSDADARL